MYKMEGLSLFFFISSFTISLSIELSLADDINQARLIRDGDIAADTINPATLIRDGKTLVSSSHIFELGFFSPGISKSRYLGIWYKESPGTVVWVANRNNPILDPHGVLSINNYGNLVLVNQTDSIIWSSNMSRKLKNPVAQLLDSGNLVLWDNSSKSARSCRWQSFDYPSDTFLPGMKLGWDLKKGVERCLTSWKSDNDPSSGDFTFRLDIQVLPQLFMYNGSMKRTRSGPWNGVSFGGIPRNPNLLFEPVLVHNKDAIYYMYEFFNIPSIMLLKLNQTGQMECLIWKKKSSGWDLMYSEPFDSCGIYGQCGANGVCSIDKIPNCECLKGFTPQSPDNGTLPKTCVRRSPLNCDSGDKFVQLSGVKLPDLLDVSLIEGISLEECKAECLKNCSCGAYANSNVSEGGRGCLMWLGDMLDIRKHLEDISGQDIYIRVPASKLGLEKRVQDTIVLISFIIGILTVGLILYLVLEKTKYKGLLPSPKSKKGDIEVPLFDLSTIATATNNFSQENLIGAGGFGPVYKGTLPTGEEIAAKRLSKNSRQGEEEFRNEVSLIAKLQHRNLVGLLGICIQGDERLLIYEYMPNKSLDYLIFDQLKPPLLTWPKRFDIVMGIVRGLLYLHQDSKLHIVHRDLKASNILLDNDLKPRISDFGLARIFKDDDQKAETKRVAGTYGYMAPEYAIDGIFSVKSDVFSFGVILLEIISGQRNRGFTDPSHNHNLLGHAWVLWNEKRALELLGSCLEDSCVESEVLRCVHVGLSCVQKYPDDRPAMSSVVFMLANPGASMPEPRQPGFFNEDGADDMHGTSTTKEGKYSRSPVTITMLEGR